MPSSGARPTGMETPMETRLLLAYIAVENMSLCQAIEALADNDATLAIRVHAMAAREQADTMSWRWCRVMDLTILDPHERIIAARQFLTDNLDEFQKLGERLAL